MRDAGIAVASVLLGVLGVAVLLAAIVGAAWAAVVLWRFR